MSKLVLSLSAVVFSLAISTSTLANNSVQENDDLNLNEGASNTLDWSSYNCFYFPGSYACANFCAAYPAHSMCGLYAGGLYGSGIDETCTSCGEPTYGVGTYGYGVGTYGYGIGFGGRHKKWNKWNDNKWDDKKWGNKNDNINNWKNRNFNAGANVGAKGMGAGANIKAGF